MKGRRLFTGVRGRGFLRTSALCSSEKLPPAFLANFLVIQASDSFRIHCLMFSFCAEDGYKEVGRGCILARVYPLRYGSE
jgi:hypothetical protein